MSSSYVRVTSFSALIRDTPKRAFRFALGGPVLGGVGGTAGDDPGVAGGGIRGVQGICVATGPFSSLSPTLSTAQFALRLYLWHKALGPSRKCSAREQRIPFTCFARALIAGCKNKTPCVGDVVPMCHLAFLFRTIEKTRRGDVTSPTIRKRKKD